jgi:cytochrome P450
MDAVAAVEALFTPEGRDDPFPYYAALHAHGPMTDLGGFAVVAGYDAVGRALRNPALKEEGVDWVNRSWPDWQEHAALSLFTDSMLFTSDPDHARVRRLVGQVFSARRVASLAPAVEGLVDGLLDRLGELGSGGAPVDFMSEFAYTLPVTVIGELLGIPEQDRLWFRPKIADLTAQLEPDLDESRLMACDAAARELLAYFKDLVALRRTAPRDDLVSALGEVQDSRDGRLSERELLCNLVVLLVAGFDTTTNLLGNGLVLLLDRPQHLAALRESPASTPGYVEEFLRYDSPVQVTSRWAPDGAVLEGVKLPPGAEVTLLIGAANRDPRRYERPDVFDPSRLASQPISFGGGPHFCLGAALARLEAQTAFPRLLRRFPQLSSAGAPVRRDRLTLRGWGQVPVALG